MRGAILVPLDGSELAERVLAYARALSIPSAAPLLLVRATRAHSSFLDTDEQAAQSRALSESDKYLSTMAADLRTRGFDCEFRTVYGAPVESIVSEAQLQSVRLIAMTTHGRTGPGRWLLGSVAEGVVAQSPVPVLLDCAWNPTRREPLLVDTPRLLVPLDGSPFAESAVEPAGRLADELGAAITLIRIESVPKNVLQDKSERPITYVDELELQVRSTATGYLRTIADQIRDRWPDVTVEVDVELGDPVEAITRTADGAGAALVVMATHGRSGLRRTLQGSVAGRVLHKCAVPVVLVHQIAAGIVSSREDETVSA